MCQHTPRPGKTEFIAKLVDLKFFEIANELECCNSFVIDAVYQDSSEERFRFATSYGELEQLAAKVGLTSNVEWAGNN